MAAVDRMAVMVAGPPEEPDPRRAPPHDTAAIMQPYFLPYIGYCQRIAAVDHFVVYDNVKYTKKGWINRNRILQHDQAVPFSLPLKRAAPTSSTSAIGAGRRFFGGRCFSISSREPIGGRPTTAYGRPGRTHRAERRAQPLPVPRQFDPTDLPAPRYLAPPSPRRRKSPSITNSLAQARVLASCEAVGATTYINAIGGVELRFE